MRHGAATEIGLTANRSDFVDESNRRRLPYSDAASVTVGVRRSCVVESAVPSGVLELTALRTAHATARKTRFARRARNISGADANSSA